MSDPDYDTFPEGIGARKGPDAAHDRFASGGAFILDEPPDTPILWGRGEKVLWPEGEGFMLCGPQGVGKSTLAQQVMLARIGIGPSEVLGLPVTRTANKVLYLAGDRPRQIARSLRRMVSDEDREHLDKHLIVWKGPPPFNVAKDTTALARWTEAQDADTLWLDSYKDLVPGLVQDDVGAMVNMAVQELLARHIEFCGLHHQRKASGDNKKPDRLDDVYGSAWLTAGLGSIALLWAKPGSAAVELTHLKQPAEPVGPLEIVHDHATGRSRVRDGDDDLLMAILNAGSKGLTEIEASKLLYDTDDVPDRKRARRRLDSLVRQEHVVLIDGKKGGAGGGGVPARWVAE